MLEYSQKNSIFVAIILVIRLIFHDKRHSLHTASRLYSMPKNLRRDIGIPPISPGAAFLSGEVYPELHDLYVKGRIVDK